MVRESLRRHRPDFIVIGAMKSATSTLHDQLAAQPGVFMSTPKEPNFFSDDAEHARGLHHYAALFAAAPAGSLRGEASTHYTKRPTHPHTVDRLVDAFGPDGGDLRFVYVMRHPVDRLVSHYAHAWTEREVTGDLEAAVDRLPALVDYGRYHMQLAAWRERFGDDRILPVFFDRLRAHPQAELERICGFLGYPGTPRWIDLPASNVSAERLRKSRVRELLTDGPVQTALRRALVPKGVRAWVRSLWQMRGRPQVSGALRARLEAIFDEDLAALGADLGTPLSCASFKDRTRDTPLDWRR